MQSVLPFLASVLFCFPLYCQQNHQILLQEGIDLYLKGMYKPSITLFLQCLPEAENAQDSTTLQSVYANLGNAYSLVGEIELALSYYHKGISLAEQTKDSIRLAKIIKNVGVLYSEQKDFAKALAHFEQAETLATLLNNQEVLADCATNKAVIYEQQGKYNEALALYEKALSIYDATGMKDRVALTYNNMGIVYKFLDQLEQSLSYYQKTLDLSQQIGDQYITAASFTNMANVYSLQKKYAAAVHMNEQGMEIARAIGAQTIIIEGFGNLADIYAASGDFKKAYFFAQRYKQTNDSLINSERSAQLAEMREKYDTEKKEAENLALRQQAEIKSLELQEQTLLLQKRNLLLVGSLVFILLFTMATYWFFMWQKGKNRRLREEAIRRTEEEERIRIARDLHDDLGSGLSKMKLITAATSNKINDMALQESIQILSETASNLVDNMRDLVWALNPENTTMDYLVARIREYANDYLEGFFIALEFGAPIDIPPIKISKETNRNVFLIVKECLQNVVKHAHASVVNIQIEIDVDENVADLAIRDNGKGFAQDLKRGNGLNNIKQRMAQIGGEVAFQSLEEKGVGVILHFPLIGTKY